VLIPTIPTGGTTEAHRSKAKELIRRVGLEKRSDHRPAELSGGERQRAAIARALVLSPAMILADEPTGNLDRTTATSIAELLTEIQREENVMLIVVTHSGELAAKMGKRCEIDDGRLRDVD
jgi:lipoprotein-releasing system ATP-binding protein